MSFESIAKEDVRWMAHAIKLAQKGRYPRVGIIEQAKPMPRYTHWASLVANKAVAPPLMFH